MVTPFDDEGLLDLDGAAALARWLADHGSDGLVVAGTTGEGSVLTDDEKLDLWRAVSEAVTIPVIAGTGSNDTAHSVELDPARPPDAGAAGVLAVTPYYNRPSQAGIEAHFRAVAAATDLPVHDLRHPRPHRPQGRPTTCSCAWPPRCPTWPASRTPPPTWPPRPAWSPPRPTSFELYSGNDDHTLALLAVGAVGRGRRGHPLGRPPDGGDDRRLRQGRHRRGPGRSTPPCSSPIAFETERRRPQPDPGQGHDAGAGPARRRVPPADGPGSRRPRGPGPRGARRPAWPTPSADQ